MYLSATFMYAPLRAKITVISCHQEIMFTAIINTDICFPLSKKHPHN